MTHADKAKALFEEGYSCAQATLLAFEEELNMDRETLARLASSFGGGVGRLREICGAMSGTLLAYRLLYGYDDPEDTEGKAHQYAQIQRFAAAFRAQQGSIVCRELLASHGVAPDSHPTPAPRDAAYKHARPCYEFVPLAAGLLEAYMAENPPLAPKQKAK